MSIDTNDLRALPAAEKLRLVEWLWDDLSESSEPIPVPEWLEREAARRMEEMRDPDFGLSHEEVWKRIDGKNGESESMTSSESNEVVPVQPELNS